MSVIELIVLSVAVWRVSHLLLNEAGPKDIFGRLRIWAGAEEILDDGSREVIESPPDGSLAQLFQCMWCLSVWLGMAAAVSYLLCPHATVAVALPFFLSGVAVLIEETRP